MYFRVMAMIDIEYRHQKEPDKSGEIRRSSIKAMSEYLNDLVCEMQMSDISSRFIDKEVQGRNMLLINGKEISEILEGLEIKMLDVEESCDMGNTNRIRFDRPPLDWNREIIEDIPDVLVKNAISKVFADVTNNRIL